MGFFSFKKKQPMALDFSVENVSKLSNMTDSLGDTLIKVGAGHMVDHLSQIRLSAERNDTATFNRHVMSNELFGGAGSKRDLWIENKEMRDKFKKQVGDFIDLVKEIGIQDRRIDQVRKEFK